MSKVTSFQMVQVFLGNKKTYHFGVGTAKRYVNEDQFPETDNIVDNL
ncbi:hypothetical protein [Dellaglioa algida]|nr:hypothetical protein [Dellaglioa algida]MDK1723826.1 hypothetical protein [Dellaglioa algida]MDK1738017.1 hypothetical protein [Dellaglioa algida]